MDTALVFAANQGHHEVVRILLQHGAKIDHQVSTADQSCIVSGASSLLCCDFVLCVDERPRMQCSRFWYSTETCLPFVCIQDVYGQTALYIASSKNHIKVVEALLVRVDAGLWLWFCLVTHSPLSISANAVRSIADTLSLTVVGVQGRFGTAAQGLRPSICSRQLSPIANHSAALFDCFALGLCAIPTRSSCLRILYLQLIVVAHVLQCLSAHCHRSPRIPP